MGAAKPCLGYPSRTQAVLALRARGLTTRQIAHQVGIDISTVTALEGSAARADRGPRPVARDQLAGGEAIILPFDVVEALRFHARKRGTSTARLAIDLLQAIVDDHLVDAVLDDFFKAETGQ